MLKRVTTAFLATSATVAAAVALGAAAAGPAAASVASHRDTVMCRTVSGCATPRLYGDSVTPVGQALMVSPYVSSLSNAPVLVAPYDPTDIMQDWTYIDYGSVSSYAPFGGFGLTAFDFRNYPSGELYALEFSPAGMPTGFCAANVSNRMVLRTCNGSAFQTYIGIPNLVGGLSAPSGQGYFFEYGLSLAQVSNNAHHKAATGSRLSDTQVTFTTPANSVNQWWGEAIST